VRWDTTLVLIGAGRVLLGSVYLVAGLRHLGILDPLTNMLRRQGTPAARVVLIVGTVFQIIAGASLMLGLYVALAAAGLALFTIAAGVLVLNFWRQEGEARAASISVWERNLGLIGGLLIAAACSLSAH
jgi:putative oxidoreductase